MAAGKLPKGVEDQFYAVRSQIRALLEETTRDMLPIEIDPAQGIDFYEAVTDHERQLIEEALRLASGKQTEAARLLSLKPTTLLSKIHALGIDLDKFKPKRRASEARKAVRPMSVRCVSPNS